MELLYVVRDLLPWIGLTLLVACGNDKAAVGPPAATDAGTEADPGECNVGNTRCGGVCIDTTNDPLNCGACGRVCGAGSACCRSGTCSSPSPQFPHRAAPNCSPRPPSLPGPVSGPDAGLIGSSCDTDADCTLYSGDTGRCLPTGASGTRGVCSYDLCMADSDCGGIGSLTYSVCACGAPVGTTRAGNVCLGADCRSDADCPACEFCSLAIGPGACGAKVPSGFFCRSLQEACTTDADCASLGMGAYCTFLGSGKGWGCASAPSPCPG